MKQNLPEEKKENNEVFQDSPKAQELPYNYFKDKKGLVLTGSLFLLSIVLGAIVPILKANGILKDLNDSYVGTLLGIIYLIIGWVYGNHITYGYRKKYAKYAEPLPLDVKNEANKIRIPFIFAALLSLLGSLIIFIIAKQLGI